MAFLFARQPMGLQVNGFKPILDLSPQNCIKGLPFFWEVEKFEKAEEFMQAAK